MDNETISSEPECKFVANYYLYFPVASTTIDTTSVDSEATTLVDNQSTSSELQCKFVVDI